MRIRDALPQWQKTGIMNPGTPGVIIQAYNVLLFDRTLSEVEPSKRHTSNGLVPKNKEETVSHYPRERERVIEFGFFVLENLPSINSSRKLATQCRFCALHMFFSYPPVN